MRKRRVILSAGLLAILLLCPPFIAAGPQRAQTQGARGTSASGSTRTSGSTLPPTQLRERPRAVEAERGKKAGRGVEADTRAFARRTLPVGQTEHWGDASAGRNTSASRASSFSQRRSSAPWCGDRSGLVVPPPPSSDAPERRGGAKPGDFALMALAPSVEECVPR